DAGDRAEADGQDAEHQGGDGHPVAGGGGRSVVLVLPPAGPLRAGGGVVVPSPPRPGGVVVIPAAAGGGGLILVTVTGHCGSRWGYQSGPMALWSFPARVMTARRVVGLTVFFMNRTEPSAMHARNTSRFG